MASIQGDQETATRVDRYLTQVWRDLRLPGLAMGIVKENQIVYLRGFGKADPTGRPVTPQTPFIIGSLSKSFTALAIMQLVEAGKLDLDTPVQHALSWFQLADPVASATITARHLLSHTSGISRFAGRELLGRSVNVGMEQRVRALRHLTPSRPLGIFQYSNTNYLILGVLIEAASGEAYGDYVRRHIFEPLDMQHSHISEQDAIADGLATGYRWMFGMPVPGHTPYLSDALAAAFLISSAQDMAQYLLACLNAGVSGDVLLSPTGFAALYQPQVPLPDKASSYALGWRVERLGNLAIFRHGGEVADFRAEMVLIPEQRLGVVALVNCNNGLVAQGGLDQVVPGVVQLLLGQRPPAARISFKQFYGLLDLAALVLFGLQLWSALRLLRPSRFPSSADVLRLLGDIGAPLIALWRLPKLADSPWSLLRYYVPDATLWLAAMGLLSLGKAILRGIRLLRATYL